MIEQRKQHKPALTEAKMTPTEKPLTMAEVRAEFYRLQEEENNRQFRNREDSEKYDLLTLKRELAENGQTLDASQQERLDYLQWGMPY